ncbi:MAG TPA: patatin-like phospholipase family protein [Gaiellaceae bacterium]|nr:patatin-like phospholipase family protein [Gaiellaceae bacterium]
MAANNGDDQRFDLVCEGGGVKGIGLAGAYSMLEQQGWKPQNVAGTSAGAITAAVIAAGYTSAEVRDITFGLDYRRFEDRSWEDRIPFMGKPLSVLVTNGIYKGDEFIRWMREILAAKGVRTFADLHTDSDDEKYRSRLQVIASDLTSRQLLVLPRDAGVLGLDPDELEVALAIRMSMSIPVFFRPVRVADKTGQDHVIVDGGILSNFPVWLFDCADDEVPEWPTFGLLLVEPDPKTPIASRIPEPVPAPLGARGLSQLFSGLFHTMMEAHDRLYIEKAQFARTIPIPTLGVRTTEFDLPRSRAQELYDSGRGAAEKFLANWDFDAYLAAFRSGKKQSRTEEVATIYRKQGAVV